MLLQSASGRQIEEAKRDLTDLIGQYGVEIIAIGNGTASRESEAFVAEVLKDFPEVSYVIVNESGASVNSASGSCKRRAIEIAERFSTVKSGNS